MERTFAGGDRVRRESGDPFWIGPDFRLPDAGGAILELRAAVHYFAGSSCGTAGRVGSDCAARVEQRCLRADWAGDADRLVEQECDFGWGVCGAVVRRRAEYDLG